MSTMQASLRDDVLKRLRDEFPDLKPIRGSRYMRKGKCPACGKPELYTFTDSP